jgi:hypothetical protein
MIELLTKRFGQQLFETVNFRNNFGEFLITKTTMVVNIVVRQDLLIICYYFSIVVIIGI